MKKLKLFSLLMLLFVGVTQMWGADYVKVTSASDLVEGQVYVIAEISGDTKYLVTGYGTKLANTTSGFSVSNNTITTSTASPLEFTLGTVTSGNTTYYTLQYVNNGTKYLGYSGSSTDFESATTTTNTKEQWSITSTNSFDIRNVSTLSATTKRRIGRNGSNIGPYATSYTACYLFKKQASTFAVTYNANGATSGDVPTDATKYQSGATVTVKGNTGNLTKTGYTFGGWNTKDDGTGTTYAADATFSISAATTLYAKWNANQYNVALASVDDVTLSASYGTSSSLAEGDNADIDYGTELTLSATGLASGYMFTWKVTDEGDNDVTEDVLDGTTLTVPAYAITISGAVQEIPLYTVTFDAGSGDCATASLKEAEQNAGVTLPAATIDVTGWSFAGWATASVANTETAPILYAANNNYKPTKDCTLYAVYKFVEGTEGQYKRATSVADITSSKTIIAVCTNASKTLTYDISDLAALSETEGKVTSSTKAVITLTGNNTDGFTLGGGGNTLGATSLPTSNGNSTDIALSSSNNHWIIQTSTCSDDGYSNHFVFKNTNGTNVALEYASSKWLAYRSSSYQSLKYYAFKVYVENWATAYNSNPAAIVNPTIAFTTAGNKSLYVQDEATYDNAANVTGISKTAVYSSSDATVATVSDAGVVTALKAGTTTITAKVEKEVGVNTEASVSYTVTVKDAKTIAGLKAITDASSVVTFTADLTDAVVTYVNGGYAYIQDASGAVYASCGSSLTAGKKINGAVTGSIKAAYKIDEITVIDLTGATVTDGDIPAALTKTVAQILASGTTLDGQLVQVSEATVTASLANGSASGGKITDDGKTSEINLYAPKSNIEALKDAEGTFKGFISIKDGTTFRFNIYDQSQITLTKNAPTDQTLTFESDAIVLDNPSDDYTAFTGQTVSGAHTTLTYSIDSDDDGVVSSINNSTGAVVLSGQEGTATIKASAEAGNTVDAGVTTPWKAATQTYTVQVRNIYDVNLVIKVDGVAEAHGNTATIAGGTATVKKHADETVALTATRTTGYQFDKWTTSSTNIEIAAADSTKTSGLSATIQGAGTIYANFKAVPELIVSVNALDLEYAKLDSALAAKKFTVRGASLTNGTLTFTLAEAIKDAFTISPASIDVNGTLAETEITVTPVTSKAGNYSGNLTISGGGVADQTVALSSEIEQTYTVTWSVNGMETTQTDIAGTALVAPATGSITGKVSRGWTDAAIDGKTNTPPTIVSLTTMPAKDTTLYALYATQNSKDSVLTFKYKITTSDFPGSGYDANDGDRDVKAVCTDDATLKLDVQWTSYQMCLNSNKIQGKSGKGKVYNKSAWGKEIKDIDMVSNSGFTATKNGAFFEVTAGGTSTVTSIEISFDSTVTVTTYNEFITNAYTVTFSTLTNGSIKKGDDVIESEDRFAAGTELTVTPAEGWKISSVTVTNTSTSADVTASVYSAGVITMPAYAITIAATFEEDEETALDNLESDVKAIKVLRDGQIFILRGENVYTVQGQLVK